VPLRFLRSRTLAGANAVMLFVGTVAAVGMPFVLTLYAQEVLGYSAIEFGVGSVVLAVAVTVGAIAAQAAVVKVGLRPVAATGMALMGAASLLLTQVSVSGSYLRDIFVGLLVCGLGIGLAFVTATAAALAGVDEHVSGLASGLSNTALQIGAALGVAILTSVAVSSSDESVAANTAANLPAVLNEGFQSAFLASVILAGIGLALALLLPGRPRAARVSSPAAQRDVHPGLPGRVRAERVPVAGDDTELLVEGAG
jgi:MFS family permease